MAIKNRIDTGKMFRAILIGFVFVMLVSWVLSEFDIMPILKGGNMLFLFLVIIFFSTLFTMGKKLGELSLKRDGLFILIVFGAIIAAFLILPSIIPQIFSVQSLEVKEFLREAIGTIGKMGTGIV